MTGLAASLGVAACKTASDITTKIAGKAVEDARVVVLVHKLITCLVVLFGMFVLGFLAFTGRTEPVIKEGFVPLILCNAVLNGVAFTFYTRAFQQSEASLVAPMMLFTPIILLFTSPLMVGASEKMSLVGVIGVVLSVVGSYVMEVTGSDLQKRSWFLPFKRLATDAGVRSMSITAFIWGFTNNIDKLGTLRSSPLVWTFSEAALISFGFLVFFLVRQPKALALTPMQISKSAAPGAIGAVGNVLQMYALTVWYVPYVVAVKRASALLTVIVGGLFFRENRLGNRSLGALIMILGVVLIALG